jgi:AraC-like DNA-binding protein
VQVVVLFGGRQEHGRLASALTGAATVVAAESLQDAHPLLEHAETRVCVVCVEARAAARSIGAIRELAERFPGLAVVAYCDVHELDRQALISTVRSGATDLIFRGIDDGQAVARHVLAHAVRRTHASALFDELAPRMPAGLRPFLQHGLQHPAAADALDETAAVFALARRTLAKRLLRLGAPSPRRFFTWTRLLLAGALLADPGRTLQSVALELQLDSGTSLRHLLRRYAGLGRAGSVSRGRIRGALGSAFLAEMNDGVRPSEDTGSGTSRSTVAAERRRD